MEKELILWNSSTYPSSDPEPEKEYSVYTHHEVDALERKLNRAIKSRNMCKRVGKTCLPRRETKPTHMLSQRQKSVRELRHQVEQLEQ